MMIYDVVELWRLVSYQLRGSLLLLVSILLMCRPRDGHLSLQYHCINTNQMVRTEEYLSAPQSPLSLIPQPNPRLRLLHLANILSQIFHISGSSTVRAGDHESRSVSDST